MKYPKVYHYLTLILILVYQNAYSQFPDVNECNCRAVKLVTEADPKTLAFYTDSEAQKFVSTLITLLNRHQPRPFVERITVIPRTCLATDIALATVCDGKNAPEGRYILFNSPRMDQIANLKNSADLFVIAHEVAHHTHNHLHFDNINKEAERQIEQAYKDKNFGIEKIKHIQELEADALAIWFLKLNNPQIDKAQILKMIEGIRGLVGQDFRVSTKDHPSFEVRVRMAERILNNWGKVFGSGTMPTSKARKFVVDEIDGILTDAEESRMTEIEKTLKIQVSHHRQAIRLVDSARVFNTTGDYGKAINYFEMALEELELSRFYTDEEKRNIEIPLEASRKIVAVKDFFAVYPVIGLKYTNANMTVTPSLQAGKKPIDAIFKPAPVIGVRMGLYSWKKKSWYELSLNYTRKEFNTLIIGSTTKNSVENFSLNSLTAGLHYTFSSLANNTAPSLSWKTGFVGTIAPTYSYYFGNQYTNYVTQEGSRTIDVRPSVGATIGLGLEKISRKRNKLLGNFRIMANYSYEKLQLGKNEPVRGDFDGTLHHLSLSISYRQW